jgi:hypothetical protein
MPFLLSHFSLGDKTGPCSAQFLAVCWIVRIPKQLEGWFVWYCCVLVQVNSATKSSCCLAETLRLIVNAVRCDRAARWLSNLPFARIRLADGAQS